MLNNLIQNGELPTVNVEAHIDKDSIDKLTINFGLMIIITVVLIALLKKV